LLAAFAGESQARNRKDSTIKWHCRNCGYVHEGKEAPDKCPVCAHPKAFFEALAENY
jgi:rubrerythrin